MTLSITNPGYIDRKNTGADALDKEMSALLLRYNKVELQNTRWFRSVTPKAGTYKESTFGNVYDLPRQSEDSAPMPYSNPVQGYPKNFTSVIYRIATRVERAMQEQDLFGTVRRRMSGMINGGKLIYEYACADIFNNAQSTGTAYLGADSKPLIANDHPHEKASTGTWSNLSTGAALSHTAYSTSRTLMRRRTNEFGDPLVVKPKYLVVPPELEETARIIMGSDQKSGVLINDKNVFQNDVEIAVNDYITDTDSWFLIGDIPSEFCGLLLGESVKPNIAPCTGSDTSTDLIFAERLRMDFFVGFTIEKNIQYNPGA